MANNFGNRMKHEKLMIDTNQNLCSSILTVVSSLLQTESLFTRTSEAISADISFLQVFISYNDDFFYTLKYYQVVVTSYSNNHTLYYI